MESYECYRRFFETSVVGFYRTTLDGQVSTAIRLLYRSWVTRRGKELASLAMPWTSTFPPANGKTSWNNAGSLGSLTNFASRLRRKDGSSVWVLENVEPVPRQDGTPAMIEGTLVDISQQKFAEAARNQVPKGAGRLRDSLPAAL